MCEIFQGKAESYIQALVFHRSPAINRVTFINGQFGSCYIVQLGNWLVNI
jgi:hypothetical protein